MELYKSTLLHPGAKAIPELVYPIFGGASLCCAPAYGVWIGKRKASYGTTKVVPCYESALDTATSKSL